MIRLKSGIRYRWVMLRALVAEVIAWYVLNVVPPASSTASSGPRPEERPLIERASFELVYGDPSGVHHDPSK